MDNKHKIIQNLIKLIETYNVLYTKPGVSTTTVITIIKYHYNKSQYEIPQSLSIFDRTYIYHLDNKIYVSNTLPRPLRNEPRYGFELTEDGYYDAKAYIDKNPKILNVNDKRLGL